MVVLALACVVFGLWPGLVTDHVLAGVVPGSETAIIADGPALSTGALGFWSPSEATGLILLGLLLGLLFLALVTVGKRVRVVRPFLAGEVPAPDDDRFRVPGCRTA